MATYSDRNRGGNLPIPMVHTNLYEIEVGNSANQFYSNTLASLLCRYAGSGSHLGTVSTNLPSPERRIAKKDISFRDHWRNNIRLLDGKSFLEAKRRVSIVYRIYNGRHQWRYLINWNSCPGFTYRS